MEDEVVVVRTVTKDSSTIVVSGGSASVQTVFISPLYLKNVRDCELTMVNLEAYYSSANIRADNSRVVMVAKRGQLSIYLQDVMN